MAELNDQDKAMIDQLAGQRLGDANAQQATAPEQVADPSMEVPAGTPPQPVPQQQAQKQEDKPTEVEKAQEAVSPKTEADNSMDESVTMIKVDFGNGDVRDLSSNQIKETFNRYKDANYKLMQNKPMQPAMDFIQSIVNGASKNGQQVGAEDVVQFLQAASQAYIKNPTMGAQKDPTPDRQGTPVTNMANLETEFEDQIKRWEEENAVSLPPMFREGFKTIQALQNDNANMRQTMNQFLASAGQINQDAAQTAVAAEQQAQDAYRQTAANNLNEIQAKYKLPDSESDDFFTFAYERGFTQEDFIDIGLVDKIMGDYVAVKGTPEMERLREMAKKRVAYTGNVTATPGSASAGGVKSDPNMDFINKVAEDAMKKRNMA
tara:strand:+ start:468 stop:1598 length:1131 start_codon:yes stop_codon:yes gene_type:complete